MSGMNMLLKSMGIDPNEIQNSVSQFGQMVLDIKTQMDRIEEKLDAVLLERSPDGLALVKEKENVDDGNN
jgi:predicted  nucleic acid-binding Zn-ribbon protein